MINYATFSITEANSINILSLFLPEGPFQSDALLVPEGCLFDHIHNASRCWPFVRWNQTGASACQERNMQMRSFAMLLPCGISLFSGVEFVCCPKHFKGEIRCRALSPSSIGSLHSICFIFSTSSIHSDSISFRFVSPKSVVTLFNLFLSVLFLLAQTQTPTHTHTNTNTHTRNRFSILPLKNWKIVLL